MRKKHAFVFSLLLLLFTACSLPRQSARPATQTPQPPEATSSPSAEPTHTPGPTQTPTGAYSGPCGWMWANEELPEVTAQLNQAFQQAGLSGVAGRASAYGENCIDPATNKAAYFTAMQTDFYLTIAVPDTNDAQALGGWVEKVLPVLQQFPPGSVPGPNPGYIGIRFTGDPGEQNLWFQRQKAVDLLSSGVSGGALYEALKTP